MSVSRTHRYRRMRMSRRRGRTGRSPVLPLLLVPLILVGLLIGVGGVGIGAAYLLNASGVETSPAEAIANRGGGARVYDRNGVLLYEFLDEEYGHQERVPLSNVSPMIQSATMAAEDASFRTNPGLNIKGLIRASMENLRPGAGFLEGTGGSSITQQLVKQLYFTPEERRERSISRKVREAAVALELTRDYSKDQILEWYLNEIPYGGILTGIEAASRGYFGIPASDVTLAQAAFLAGLPQSPGEYDPFTHFEAAVERQREVLDLMVKHDFITAEAGAWAKYEVITLNPEPRPFLAPHFVNMVGDYIRATLGEEALLRGGLDVRTTLDLNLQNRANAILEEHLQTYEDSTQGHNGAVVIIEPPTGRVLAMIGSRDYFRDDIDGRNNNALALNSPGSTLKPFTYVTAFMQGWGPEWPIIDTAINYKELDGKTFSPRNPDGRTRGRVTLKEALGNSYNIPAFKTILWTGVDNMINTTKAMGLTTLDRDLGPAVTLGGVDVKLYDMVYGYSTFANNGVMAGAGVTETLPPGNRTLDPITVLTVTNKRGEVLLDNTKPEFDYVIDPEYAYMITDILSNDKNRQITYGVGSNLNIPGHRVAAKTGTSEPYEGNKLIGDTWTIGYTPDLAVGVWVGNSDNTPMVNIFSTTIAGRTWHDTFVAALEGRPARDWVKPAGLEEATVCVPSGKRVTEKVKCQSVKGTFATKALERDQAIFWGGQDYPDGQDPAKIPADVTGLKRYLAEEYLRRFVPPAPRRAPAPPPAAPVAPPPTDAVPPPQDQRGGDGNGNNGNGNGNGNGN